MSKYTFTIEADNVEDFDTIIEDGLEMFKNTRRNSYIMFELIHNFHRRFKHMDGHHEEFYKGVDHVLDELQNLINEHYED